MTITATPSPGDAFIGWEGDASGITNPLSLTMNASKTIRAKFSARPRLQVESIEGNASSLRVIAEGDLGQTLKIEKALSFGEWAPVHTGSNSLGRDYFTVPVSAEVRQQFYRAVVVP